MQSEKLKVLVVGLFLSPSNQNKILRTAADQLAELLKKNNYPVITVSDKVNQVGRFLHTLWVVISRASDYSIAIVPLYGGMKSYIWEAATSTVLKLLGKKVVLIVHGGSIPARMKQDPAKYLRSFKRADLVVCPSNFIAKALAKHNVPSVIIENVVNIDDYVFQQKERFRPSLFWMRTLEDIYNPEMAVRVFALISKRYPQATLVMAGYDRGSLALVKQLAEQLGVLDKIDFPGYISHQQKLAYSNSCDIYVCTNRIDNAPVSFIEMMALGLPIVSVNVDGIPDLVTDNETALLVALDDDEAMASRIMDIVEHPQKGQALAENGRRYSRKFSEEAVMEKWKSAFDLLTPAR